MSHPMTRGDPTVTLIHLNSSEFNNYYMQQILSFNFHTSMV